MLLSQGQKLWLPLALPVRKTGRWREEWPQLLGLLCGQVTGAVLHYTGCCLQVRVLCPSLGVADLPTEHS